LLLEYTGTLLLVSHDRAFLNNVVTCTLVFEGDGQVNEYVGGYDDWRRQAGEQNLLNAGKKAGREKKPAAPGTAASAAGKKNEKKHGSRKLGYREQRELEALPQHIEKLEEEQKALFETMSEPSFYQEDGERIAAAKERAEALERELGEAYEKWELLESRQQN